MENINIQLKKFQIIMIDEKRTHVLYNGCDKKGPRPYLIVRPDIYGGWFTACPLTDVETANKWPKQMKKSYLETNVMGDTSYIKMNFPVIFKKDIICQGIAIPMDKNLNKSQRNIAMKLLKEAFDD